MSHVNGLLSARELCERAVQHRDSIRHGKRWGKWTLDAPRFVLVYEAYPDNEGGFNGIYEVDLERMCTPAAMLDWIFQCRGHGFDVNGLLDALEDLLNPQQNLCGFAMCGSGKGRTIRPLDVLKRTIRDSE